MVGVLRENGSEELVTMHNHDRLRKNISIFYFFLAQNCCNAQLNQLQKLTANNTPKKSIRELEQKLFFTMLRNTTSARSEVKFEHSRVWNGAGCLFVMSTKQAYLFPAWFSWQPGPMFFKTFKTEFSISKAAAPPPADSFKIPASDQVELNGG